MSSVSFKIIFLIPGQDPAIHRFSLESGFDLYDRLKNKIMSLEKKPAEAVTEISWKDSEGDMITLDGQDTLEMALQDLNEGDNLKLFVRDPSLFGKQNGPFNEQVTQTIHNLAQKQAQEALRKHTESKPVHFSVNVPGGASIAGSSFTTSSTSSTTTKPPEAWKVDATKDQSLEDMFQQLSSNGADYLRQLGDMINKTLESLDSYVEDEDDEVSGDNPKGEMAEDVRHQDGLKQLLGMGYTNDGGWLSKLLEINNGDVAKTLKCLKPSVDQKKEN